MVWLNELSDDGSWKRRELLAYLQVGDVAGDQAGMQVEVVVAGQSEGRAEHGDGRGGRRAPRGLRLGVEHHGADAQRHQGGVLAHLLQKRLQRRRGAHRVPLRNQEFRRSRKRTNWLDQRKRNFRWNAQMLAGSTSLLWLFLHYKSKKKHISWRP